MEASAVDVPSHFASLLAGTGGIDSWLLKHEINPEVTARLSDLPGKPLTRSQLNQLLVFASEAGVSDGFFRYYWLSTPSHTYDVKKLPRFDGVWLDGQTIVSLDHLYWGLYRLYIDALLYFGNIRSAYRALSDLSEEELHHLFTQHRLDTDSIIRRGPPLDLRQIPFGDRYLIGEQACKSLEPSAADESSALERVLLSRYADEQGSTTLSWRDLLFDASAEDAFPTEIIGARFSASEMLDEKAMSREGLVDGIKRLEERWRTARDAALRNTANYLSMVEDLDVYVATSMRERAHFVEMAEFCEQLFSDPRLAGLHLRYFDPTLSAAESHEDKGLIECLMVKCAKVLVYVAGDRDSYGKDAEAAMALSLGKPVIFYCREEWRREFMRDLHPLSRLIDFQTGVAVGGMAAGDVDTVAELLSRIFTNDMQYRVTQPRPGYLKLIEKSTKSTVRVQTSDELLRTTFWNYYHKQPRGPLGLPRQRYGF